MENTTKNTNSSDFVVSEDHSLLIKPIMMKSSTVHNIVTFVHDGTPEVRDLLINECEMIFECKVCRSLHRSLANFIAHKRVYCKEHCCEKMTLFEQTEIENETVIVNPESPKDDDCETANEEEKLEVELNGNDFAPLCGDVGLGVSIPKIFQLESGFSGSRQKSIPSSPSEVDDKSDDTSSSNRKSQHLYDDVVKHLNVRKDRRLVTTVKMTKIDSNRNAVYQSVSASNKVLEVGEEIAVKEEPMERDESTEREIKVEMPKLKMAPHVVSAHRSTTKPPLKGGAMFNNNIVSVPCIKCRTLFTSIKTLTRHLKSVHGKTRIYFNCLFCSSKFSESWSVIRHILAVHKKTKKQTDKLRKKICQRAFQNILDDRDSSEDESEDTSVSTSPETSKSLLPTIILQKKQIVHLKCRHCDKIFTKDISLKSHERNCSEKSKVEKKISDISNGRPKRVVKRKQVSDFVPISLRNTSKREKRRESSIVAVTALDIIDAKTLECNRCLQKFSTMSNARRHAAMHIGWNRFKCKHCDYQSYDRSSCCYHIKRVHATRRLLQGPVDKHIQPVSPSTGLLEKSKDDEDSDQSTKLAHLTKPNSTISKCSEQQPVSEGKKDQPVKKELESGQSQNANKTNTVHNETSPPTLVGKITPDSTRFNISTRRHPRFFDISPYRREDKPITSLVTRSGSYAKPEQDVETQRKGSTSRRKANVKHPERVVPVESMVVPEDQESSSIHRSWEIE